MPVKIIVCMRQIFHKEILLIFKGGFLSVEREEC